VCAPFLLFILASDVFVETRSSYVQGITEFTLNNGAENEQ